MNSFSENNFVINKATLDFKNLEDVTKDSLKFISENSPFEDYFIMGDNLAINLLKAGESILMSSGEMVKTKSKGGKMSNLSVLLIEMDYELSLESENDDQREELCIVTATN